MASLTSATPYTEDTADKQGRVAIQSTEEKWYNTNTNENPGGSDQTVPYENEFAHSEQGDFVVLMRDANNNVVPVSASRDLRKKIEKWESEHIFENAEAFVFNSQVNILYFDNDRMTVKISPDRVFSATYKYWAIKGVDGIYYTGITTSDGTGNISSNLVETEVAYDGDGNPVGVTCTGHLVNRMTHGNNYVVQFFDEEGILLSQTNFQAMGVRNMAYNVQPADAITDICAVPANQGGSSKTDWPDTFTINQGGSWKDLALRFYLIYGDEHSKDVTAEWSTNGGTTGRLHVSGLDAIDTSVVTDTANGVNPQEIEVRYYLSSANVENPLVDPDTFSISHKYKIVVVPNQNEEPVKVLPVMWMERMSETASAKSMNMRLVALNAYGSAQEKLVFTDYTYRLRSKFGTEFANFEVKNENDPYRVKYVWKGGSGVYDFTIALPFGTMNETKQFKIKFDVPNNESEVGYVVIGPNESEASVKEIKHMSLVTTTGTEGSRLFFTLPTGTVASDFINSLKEEYGYKAASSSNKVLPTHIRIRSAKNSGEWNVGFMREVELTTDTVYTGSSSGILFDVFDADTAVTTGTPLVVEFVHKSNDGSESFVTGIEVFYVREASTN
ncbi:MAG: hypothetical protein IJ772_04660 [Bacilli bacterium]|nr:hypothetical protein [Bacilli bacterium]